MLNKFSEQEAQRILAEARAALERGRREEHQAADDSPVAENADRADARAAFEPPDRLAEWRRWHAEQEMRFVRERAREQRRLDTPPISYADIDQRIAAALHAERTVVIPTIRQAFDEILDAEREHHKSELVERTRGLELAVAKLESALAALQLTLAAERSGKPLDANLSSVN